MRGFFDPKNQYSEQQLFGINTNKPRHNQKIYVKYM